MSKKNSPLKPPTEASRESSETLRRPETLLLEQMKALKERATINLDTVPANVRAAFGASRSEAKDKLEVLKKEYSRFVHDSAVLLFLRGDRRRCAAFAELARVMGPVAVVDTDTFYREMADLIVPQMRGRGPMLNFDTPEYVKIVNALMTFGSDQGLDAGRPIFHHVAFSSEDQVVGFMRKMAFEVFGNNLTNLLTNREVLAQSLEVGFHTTVPIVVINAGDDEESISNNLVGDEKRVMVKAISKNDEINEDAVTAALEELAALASRV